MKYYSMRVFLTLAAVWFLGLPGAVAQSMYGDKAKADVKVKYVYSLEEALKASAKENKPVFFNCFADWATPCHSMNKVVFSDREFARWLNDHFVCLYMDMVANNDVAVKYDVKVFAHYLILDSRGKVIHRIVGGCRLPEFKHRVERGLLPGKGLTTMTQKYDAGERDAAFLFDYINVLRYAPNKDRLKTVTQEYVAAIKEEDLIKKENWLVYVSLLENAGSERFPFLLDHYDAFVKENGKKTVDDVLSVLFIRSIYPFVFDEADYDKSGMATLEGRMDRFLAKDDLAYVYLEMARARGEHRFQDFINLLKTDGYRIQSMIRSGVELGLPSLVGKYPELKQTVDDYLSFRLDSVAGAEKRQYQVALDGLRNLGQGIKFEEGEFADVLAKAKKEGKPVFMDCYTSWCGPCKVLSSKVFPLKSVGDFFNARFVSTKIDMEKGEGKELARKYGVKAFPTLLVLDAEGNVIHRLTGGRSPQSLIAEVSRALSDSTAYTAVKKKYEAGDRSPLVVTEYFKNMLTASEITPEALQKEAETYFSSLSDKEKLNADMLVFYKNFVADPKTESARYFLYHRNDYRKLAGEKAEKDLLGIYFPALLNTLPEPDLKKADLQFIMKDLEESGCLKEKSTLGYLGCIVKTAADKDWEGIFKIYTQKVAHLDYNFGRMNLDLVWKRFWPLIPEGMKKDVKDYIEQGRDRTDKHAVNHYNALLDILK